MTRDEWDALNKHVVERMKEEVAPYVATVSKECDGPGGERIGTLVGTGAYAELRGERYLLTVTRRKVQPSNQPIPLAEGLVRHEASCWVEAG